MPDFHKEGEPGEGGVPCKVQVAQEKQLNAQKHPLECAFEYIKMME